MKSDRALIEELIGGNPDAMGALYTRYRVPLRTVILGVLGEESEADEILNDVFLQLWYRAEDYLPEKCLRGFLVTVARRRALDRFRRRQAYQRATGRFGSYLNAELSDRERSAVRVFTNIDLAELMEKLIKQLPPPQQEVVRLTFYKGLSQREIAAEKALALGTVKARLYLAHKKLLRRLTDVQETL
ncbi:MAG: sigma-70 family RNA polymerase sigma factor [Verrucomicrobia bacterium]|nr:sigma-70 family RNA polymerase sigma factor [Verrucomicrobiota bacterium]